MKAWRRIIDILYLLFMIAILSGCSAIQATPTPISEATPTATSTSVSKATPTATSTPKPSPTPFEGEEISFVTEDHLRIYGKIYRGGGDLAIILAHQRDRLVTQKSWQSFAQLLASKGYTALTFNFRGIGRSEGNIDAMENEVMRDVSAAIKFLQAEGFDRIVCIGAGMGGSACLAAAPEHNLAGLVVITAAMSLGEPTKVTEDDLKNLTMPKLFICTTNNRFGRIVKHTQIMYDNSPEPKQLKFFPGTVHGTELFFTEHKEEFRRLLLDFVEGLR